QLSVFDLQGREVQQLYASAWLQAGTHQVQLEAQDWEAGMYLIRLATAEEVVTKQLVLQR
ncbi:MAG: T9SS type A sorting domain-containing protein, partial [Bacteroidota bacterium]